MFFKKKAKTPAIVPIDSVDFLTEEAKEAFRVLEIPDTSYLQGKEGDPFYYDYCVESGGVVDKSILYEMRALAYFANTVKPDEKKLRWWYWKDTNTEKEELYDEE